MLLEDIVALDTPVWAMAIDTPAIDTAPMDTLLMDTDLTTLESVRPVLSLKLRLIPRLGTELTELTHMQDMDTAHTTVDIWATTVWDTATTVWDTAMVDTTTSKLIYMMIIPKQTNANHQCSTKRRYSQTLFH